jgi:hypothetical protein
MDWASALLVLLAIGLWIGIVRFVLPRFGIKGG